tara:strand:+ start:400 stop:897 length:498 start_codon:yes stop_codon:yes gene_type:complete
MSNLNDGFDLISMMVNETFDGVEEDSSYSETLSYEIVEKPYLITTKEAEPIQLEFYYDFYLGGFDCERKCYIFQVEEEVLEFPENWGPFKLSTVKTGSVEDLFSMQKHEDIDYFFEVIESLTDKSFKSFRCLNCGTHLKLVYEIDVEQKSAEIIPFRVQTTLKAA